MGTLVEFGKLAKPATVLIKKISDATGVLYEPTRIKRKAKAEADASKTKALIDLEIEDIQKRALNRLITEEIKKQENIENITEKSFSSLDENATPENIEDDWLTNFFDKCKLISDKDMQTMWSKILAGESNNPGTFSKRTIELMSSLDKSDALLFNNFCKLCCTFGKLQPLIYNYKDSIYKKYNIDFSTLTYLDELGLITFDNGGGFNLTYNISDIKDIKITYYDKILYVHFKNEGLNSINTGLVNFTKIGHDLALINNNNINNHNIDNEYYDYILNEIWNKQGYIVSEPLSNKIYNKSLEEERVTTASI